MDREGEDWSWPGQGARRPEVQPFPPLQDDHRRAARHIRQHAGRVALLACRSLSLRGRQQSQETGMKVARSLPQVTSGALAPGPGKLRGRARA